MDYWRCRALLFELIPSHPQYGPFAAKTNSPFYETYMQLRGIVESVEYIPRLEDYLDRRSQCATEGREFDEEFQLNDDDISPKNDFKLRINGGLNGKDEYVDGGSFKSSMASSFLSERTDVTSSTSSIDSVRTNGGHYVARKPVGSGLSTPDPLMERFAKLRGPREMPSGHHRTTLKMPDHPEVRLKPNPPPPQPLEPPPPPPPPNQIAQFNEPIIFPKATVINTETLAKYLRQVPESILILDVRPRPAFDQGHIEAPNSVCIEPVSLRRDLNDDGLEDTLVIAPLSEQDLFTRRGQFELIVYYDEDSRSNAYKGGPTDAQTLALHYLVRSMYELGFTKPLKRPPCLLVGGYEAWTEDFSGRHISKSAPTAVTVPREIPSRPYGSRKGSLVGTQSYARDVNDYFRSAPTLVPYPMNDSNYYDSPPYSQPQPYTAEYGGDSRRTSQSYPEQYRGDSRRTSQTYLDQSRPRSQFPEQYRSDSRRTSQAYLVQYPSYPPQPQYIQQTIEYDRRRSSSGSSLSLPPVAVASPRPVVYASTAIGAQEPPPPTAPLAQPAVTRNPIEFTTGLKNLGNTCYMNSIIQCLAGTPALANSFVDGSYRRYVNVNSKLGYKGVLAQKFAELVQTMQRENVAFVGPIALKELSGQLREQFRGYEQQDCQEFLTFVMDGLHEELNMNGDKDRLKELTEDEERRRESMSVRMASTIEWERYLKSDFSLVVDTVQGQYQSKLRCLACGHTSTTYNAFSFLSLPIPLHKSRVTLQDCFDLFTAEEVLDGDDAWHCPKCKLPRRSIKVLHIARLPPILIIHLKRFQQRRGGSDKLETAVTYPLHNLDLTGYWPSYLEGDEQKLMKLPIRGQSPPFRYDLYAVANHFGTLKGGHYTAFVKKGRKGWCYFDDVRVTKSVSEENVINKQAYVLFYERRANLR
jgi:ubiquitin carboxyl-terminal hydrolase 8